MCHSVEPLQLGAWNQDDRNNPPIYFRAAITASGDKRTGIGYVQNSGQRRGHCDAGLWFHDDADCASAPDMACPSASGLIKCGVSVSVALLPGDSIGFTDTGSHPVLTARSTFYQDPFLASITPPPEHHS